MIEEHFIIVDTVSTDTTQQSKEMKKNIADCGLVDIEKLSMFPISEGDVVFTLNSNDMKNNKYRLKERVKELKREEKINKIKTIYCSKLNFTLPHELSEFKNAENIMIIDGDKLEGMSALKNIKRLYLIDFWGKLSSGSINENITHLVTEKGAIKGLANLKSASNLKVLKLSATKFDSIPEMSNFEELQVFSVTGCTMYGKVKENIDFSKCVCLRVLVINHNQDNLYSSPKGYTVENLQRISHHLKPRR